MAENVVTETVTPTTTASPVANENQAVSSCNPRTCPHYQENEDHNSSFECNICLDTARDAVISFCGHLFCWSCLHQWLETRPNRQMCPVCKSAIGKDKVVPLYGRNGENKDPRDKVPPRPQGQRSEPTTTNFNGFNMAGIGDGGFQFSFGIGAFPFAMFASIFSFGDHRPAAPLPGSGQFEAEQTLNRLFIVVGLIFIIWLLLV